MHDDTESIAALQRCLVVYRRTIKFLEVQRAQFGAFTPPYIWHQFDDTRNEIARVKRELRDLGIEVEDHPADEDAREEQAAAPGAGGDNRALLLTYHRMLVDQVRFLTLAGMSGWSELSFHLADLYIERTLAPLGIATARNGGSVAEANRSRALADIVRPNGARVLLEGEAGSGKSVCLHMLTLACAARAAGDPDAATDLVAGWPDPLPLPLLLSASEIASALSRADAAPDAERMPTLSAFWSAIETWLHYSNLQALVPGFQDLLERGGCMVLIDGLDELPAAADRHVFLTALARFVARYPDNRFVIACRGYDAGVMAPLTSFTRYTLAPLDPRQQESLVERWYTSVADRAGLLGPECVRDRIETLLSVLRGDTRLQRLALTPQGLALCVLAHAEGRTLPADRVLVLRRLAELLLNGWDHGRATGAPSLARMLGAAYASAPERRLALLEPLALAFHMRPATGEGQPVTLRSEEIESLLSQSLARLGVDLARATEQVVPQVLAWLLRRGLLAKIGHDAYTMPLRQVREYLAARALAARSDFPNRAFALRHDPHWREPLLLALRKLGSRATPHVARLFVRLLLHIPETDPAVRIRDLLLAAECLLEIGDRSRSDYTLRAELQERLAELMHSGAAALEQRIQAGMLLGRLGDVRLDRQQPPLVDVPAGPFIMGTSDGYDDEGPEHWVEVEAFSIAVYPVTNHEYAAFLAANRGYLRPRYWHDPRYNNPACPVVGVTWHDAMAYCDWLTKRLRSEGLLAPDLVVRLPLESEWEKAASWDEARQAKRRFPWGDEWSNERANTAEGRGDWLTSPVGSYPDGVSPYGLHDCVGNVWEWTASIYASYPGAVAPFREDGAYTLRGSSCAANPTHARCTYRSRLPPGYWRYHLGFRIVVARPLADNRE